MTTSSLNVRRLAILVVCLAVGLLFWDSPLLWPLKILVVMIHESGHAVASLLVGGSVDRISISGNEAGQCLSRLPDSALGATIVYSAGYVGSALVGGVLLLSTYRYGVRRWMLGAASAWLVVMGLLYGRDLFTIAFCLGTAAVLAAAARWLPAELVDVVNLFLAAFCALYAVFDLRSDLWDGATRAHSDAALLAQLTSVPPIIWAVLWTAASLAILGAFLWRALRAPERLRARPMAMARARG
ncbi:MAG TPA: M50 family metallopeptidase [Myxococcales bacterium]|jgi:hypothetical protein|nr:M50 family metallopeptidase [Myxococcales bacterium]